MADAGKTSELEAMSAAVKARFDDVPWDLFNSSHLASREETRFMVLRARDDLLKVAALDAPRAARIWDEHVPTYVPRPPELPVRDADPEPGNTIEPGRKRTRARPEAFLDGSEVAGRQFQKAPLDQSTHKADPEAAAEATAKAGEKGPKAAEAAARDKDDPQAERLRLLLDGLNKQYVQAEDKYHFRDRGREVAFEDREKKLVTMFDTPSVVSSMIDLAETKGWSSLKLTGTDEFKREAWLQASVRGFEVSGFRPTKHDQARLAELRAEVPGVPQNAIARDEPVDRQRPTTGFAALPEEGRTEPAVSMTPIQEKYVRTLEAIMRHRGDSEEAIAKAHQLASDRLTGTRVHLGTLVEIGTAPYQDKKGEKESHFMTLRDEKGATSKVWGVDLPRALKASQAEPGDTVAIVYRGRKPVTVDVPVKDEAGRTVEIKFATVDRNSWEVVQFDRLRSDAKASVLKAVEQQNAPGNIKILDRSAKSVTVPTDLKAERPRARERTL